MSVVYINHIYSVDLYKLRKYHKTGRKIKNMYILLQQMIQLQTKTQKYYISIHLIET